MKNANNRRGNLPSAVFFMLLRRGNSFTLLPGKEKEYISKPYVFDPRDRRKEMYGQIKRDGVYSTG